MSGDARTITISGPTGHTFGGLGFHLFEHLHDAPERVMDKIIMKRWKELNPSFARLTHTNADGQKGLKALADHMKRLMSTGTEFYLTTWDPPVIEGSRGMEAYAEDIAGQLEYLVREEGILGLRTYCCANELSQSGMGWSSMIKDLPLFKDFHTEIRRALDRRGLSDIALLATDASPVDNWWTLEWASGNMDDVTGAYGGHHYFNDISPDSPGTYPWFHERVSWAVGLADSRKKPFIIGEYGPKQNTRHPEGIRLDACEYWGTAMEPMVALQVCEAAMAATNAGAYATAYWTFMDFPDLPGSYQNKWGLFKWSGDDFSIRPHYYAFGLLTRAFRGGGTVLKASSSDPLIRVMAISQPGGTWAVALANRNDETVSITLDPIAPGDAVAYVYEAAAPPAGSSHTLQEGVPVESGASGLHTTLPPLSLTVVTTQDYR